MSPSDASDSPDSPKTASDAPETPEHPRRPIATPNGAETPLGASGGAYAKVQQLAAAAAERIAALEARGVKYQPKYRDPASPPPVAWSDRWQHTTLEERNAAWNDRMLRYRQESWKAKPLPPARVPIQRAPPHDPFPHAPPALPTQTKPIPRLRLVGKEDPDAPSHD